MAGDRNQREPGQQEQLRQEIIKTREDMASKLEEIMERVDHARSKLRDAREKLNPRYQMHEHPWLMVGLSAVAGFAAYRLFHSDRANQVVTRGLGGTARHVAGRATQGARVAKGAAWALMQNVQHGAAAMRNLMDKSPLVRGAVHTAARTAFTTLGGIVLGAVYERFSGHKGRRAADDQDDVIVVEANEAAHGTARSMFDKDMAEEIPYEEISAPAAASVENPAEQ